MRDFFYELLIFLRIISRRPRSMVERRSRQGSEISLQALSLPLTLSKKNPTILPLEEQSTSSLYSTTRLRSSSDGASPKNQDNALADFLRSPNPDGSPRISYAAVCPSAHFNRSEKTDFTSEHDTNPTLRARSLSTSRRHN
jgi:hypothetical protein